MEIKIALVVGSNQKYAVGKINETGPDWDFLLDCIGVYDEKTKEMTYPDNERRYIVTVDVELPMIETVAATKIEAA